MADVTPPSAKPGDVVNGHVLTADGAWMPIGHSSDSTPAGSRSPRRTGRFGPLAAGIVVLLPTAAGAAYLLSRSNGEEAAVGQSAGEGADAAPSEPNVVADMEGVTGCSPFNSVPVAETNLATSTYVCDDLPEAGGAGKSFLLFYDSAGSLQTDLSADKTKEGQSYVNAVLSGDNWLFYTYSRAQQAAVIDYGGTLQRDMDAEMAVD